MKLHFFTLSLGVIVGVGVHSYFADVTNPLVNTCDAKTVKESGVFPNQSSSQSEFNQLKLFQEENAMLKLALKEAGNPLPNKKSIEQPVSDASIDNIRNKMLNEFKAIQAAADFERYLTNSTVDYKLDVDNKFKEESVDSEWASKHEVKIINFFRENHTLDEFVPELVECKSTKCKIRINVANPEDSNRLTELFSIALIENDLDGAGTKVISAPNTSKGIVDLYVGKNDDVKLF